MQIAQVQFTPWDKAYNFSFDDLNLALGDKVLVETEVGEEIGEVVCIFDSSKKGEGCKCPNKGDCQHKEKELKPIKRKADVEDLARLPKKKDKDDALEYCKGIIHKYELPMKLVDVLFSLDGSRVTFAFIADGRVDFRELVKDLTRHFSRSVRLHQIGIRDEAKFMGDFGHCGRQLCCKSFLKDFVSITSEMAEAQACGHRGSDRISGVCGRLMCCLNYELKGYEEMAKRMPPMGARVNVDGKKGVVVGHNILKQTVNVLFDPEKEEKHGAVIEVDLNRHKK